MTLAADGGATWSDPASFSAGEVVAEYDLSLRETLQRQAAQVGVLVGDGALTHEHNPIVLRFFFHRETPDAQIDRAWRLAYSRPADDQEKLKAVGFLQKQQVAGSTSPLADLCHVLLNSNEFLYIN